MQMVGVTEAQVRPGYGSNVSQETDASDPFLNIDLLASILTTSEMPK